jgi:hypothetical protein
MLRILPSRILVVVGLAASYGQAQPSTLRIMIDPAMASKWTVTKASFEQGPFSGYATLRMRNLTAQPVEEARFYAQYYDASGRFCLSLAFVAQVNAQKKTSPIVGGESRDLISYLANMSPATAPTAVRVQLVSQRAVGQPWEIVSGETIVRSPVVAPDFPRGSESVKLALDPSLRQAPTTDLALATVTIGPSGQLEDEQMISSADATVRSWFEDLIGKVGFAPATEGSISMRATALILLRYQAGDGLADVAERSPLRSQLLASFVAGAGAAELPPVMVWGLEPPAVVSGTRSTQVTDPNVFQLSSAAGVDWSVGVFKFTRHVSQGPASRTREWLSIADAH